MSAPGVGPAALGRARPGSSTPTAADVLAFARHAPHRRARRRRHARAERGERRGHGRHGRPTCPTSTSWATPGAWAGSASAGTGTGSSATTATPSARPRSCACCPSRAWPSPCSPTAGRPATSTRSSTARSSPSVAGVRDAAPARPAGGARRGRRRRRFVGRLRAGVACAWRCWRPTPSTRAAAAHDGHRNARRAGARADQGVPHGRRRARRCSWSGRRRPRPGSPVTFYALPTGERYLHFGARGHASRGLTAVTAPQAAPAAVTRS